MNKLLVSAAVIAIIGGTISYITFSSTRITDSKSGLKISSPQTSICPSSLPFGPPIYSGNLQVVCHTAYSSGYDNEILDPRWVGYILTGSLTFGCLPRTNNFKVDPILGSNSRHAKPSDYDDSGYDKGHQAPVEDFAYDKTAENESFLMANMAPQKPGLNRAEWERLEETVRDWAWERGQLLIYVGPIVSPNDSTIGEDHIVVPDAFYKIIVDSKKNETLAFIMKNDDIPKGDLSPYEVSISEVEKETGINFPIPSSIDKTETSPIWSTNLPKWRAQHRTDCR